MADGDITLVSVNSDGYSFEATTEGMSIGGSYDFGLGSENSPSVASVVFSLTSEGYSGTTLGTVGRTLYGVPCIDPTTTLGAMRKAYPSQTSADETATGTSVLARVAMSDFIYNDDTNVSASFLDSWYTSGTVASVSTTSMSVTNGSALDYPMAVGNWAIAQNELILTNTVHLEFVVFHKFGQSGRPVNAVEFILEDQNTNTVTSIVTEMTVSADSPQAKIITYAADISASTLTDGDILTAKAKCYPWIGDADSILNTDDGVNSFPTPLYTNLTMRLDIANDHGWTVVDATSGNDGTGAVYGDQSSAESGSYFQTIAAALTAMQTYNNSNAGHNDAGGGTILLTEDTHLLDSANGGTLDTWITIKPISAALKANVELQADGTNAAMPNMLKIEGLTFSGAGFFTASDTKMGYVKDCNMVSSGIVVFYKFVYGVAHNCTGAFPNDFMQFGSTVANWALIRGNNVTGFHDSIGWTILGNVNVGVSQRATAGIPLNNNLVYAYNQNDDSVTTTIVSLAITENYDGVAVVQNLFVRYGSQVARMLEISADGTQTETNNVLFWNNTLAGARSNFGYNGINTATAYYQNNWSFKNNIVSNYNNKDDVFATNSGAVGSWPVGYMVGGSGNHFRTTASEGWLGEHHGLWMKNGTVAVPLEPEFIEDNSADGNDTSGGDYHLTLSAPSLNLSKDQVLPYDFDGIPRSGTDNPGAFTYNPYIYPSGYGLSESDWLSAVSGNGELSGYGLSESDFLSAISGLAAAIGYGGSTSDFLANIAGSGQLVGYGQSISDFLAGITSMGSGALTGYGLSESDYRALIRAVGDTTFLENVYFNSIIEKNRALNGLITKNTTINGTIG